MNYGREGAKPCLRKIISEVILCLQTDRRKCLVLLRMFADIFSSQKLYMSTYIFLCLFSLISLLVTILHIQINFGWKTRHDIVLLCPGFTLHDRHWGLSCRLDGNTGRRLLLSRLQGSYELVLGSAGQYQCSPLSLVEVQQGWTLIGRELQSVACASNLMP